MGCCASREEVSAIKNNEDKKVPELSSEKKEEKPKKEESNVEKSKESKSEEKVESPPQAGGHGGSLRVIGDKLYKRAGSKELKFYESLFSEETTDQVLINLRRFVPNYYGVEEIEGKKYLILENLLLGYDNPSLLDCKIGKVTWTRDHNEKKTKDQQEKAATTTTGTLGFRITGFVIKDENGNLVESISKKAGFENINAENIHLEFKKVVGNDQERVRIFIAQTQEILDWFLEQRSKHFFTASVFYVSGKNKCQTRFIDFAHVFDAEGQPDHSNF